MTIRDVVSGLFAGLGIKVYAAKYTRGNNIALSMSPPSAATALASNSTLRDTLVDSLRTLFTSSDEDCLSVYPDDKWHRVVINHIPAMDDLCPTKSEDDILKEIRVEWREYNRLAREIPDSAFAHMRLLVPQDAKLGSLKTVSICLVIPDVKQARQLLREGAFFFGEHCRASVYIPRHR
jgi:hypothetical protein